MPSQATEFAGLPTAVPDALVGVDRAGRIRFQRLTARRELTMIELRRQIEYLEKHGPAGGGER